MPTATATTPSLDFLLRGAHNLQINQLTPEQVQFLHANMDAVRVVSRDMKTQAATAHAQYEAAAARNNLLQGLVQRLQSANLVHLDVPLVRSRPTSSQRTEYYSEAARGTQVTMSDVISNRSAIHSADMRSMSTEIWPDFENVRTYLRLVQLSTTTPPNGVYGSWIMPARFNFEIAEMICRDWTARGLLPEGMTFGATTL